MPKTAFENLNADTTFKRSTWNPKPPRWTSDMRHGFIYPVQVLEVLPSDSWKVDLRHYTRMNQPIAPIFGDIFQHVSCFFVPKRILNDKIKQFYGEAETFGVATTINEPTITSNDYIVPRSYLNGPDKWCTFGSAFGLVTNLNAVPTAANRIPLNVLPIQAFGAIYNEYFRNENYQPKFMWDKTQSGNSTSAAYMTLNGSNITAKSTLPQCNKELDIFTGILPYALKSTDPVTIPLSGNAPLVGNVNINPDGQFVLTADAAGGAGSIKLIAYPDVIEQGQNNAIWGTSASSDPVYEGHPLYFGTGLKGSFANNSYADLSEATAASLSSLIYALSYQYYLTKLAKGGSKYGEYLEIMFGAKCPAATRDEPEFLGHYSWKLNIDTVVQTTGYDDSSSSELGAVGANSQTAGKDHLINASFTEPGYIIIVTYCKHFRSYGTAMNPVFLKKELLDYYSTPFANIPDVSMDSELMYFTGDITQRKSLGFVEPWLDYKVFASQTFGGMNPNNPNSYDFWTLGDKITSQPTITGDWLKEDRNAIARALTSGVSGSDYICDMFFDIIVSRTMPLYSSGMGTL